MKKILWLGALLCAGFSSLSAPVLGHDVSGHQVIPLVQDLARLAPHANPRALSTAARAWACVNQYQSTRVLGMIDYSLPSSEPRLWVFDLQHRTLLFKLRVAHGQGTGQLYASSFSNQADTHMSSLGAFVPDGAYIGRHGLSLRLKGVDGRFNSHAEQRAIVVHGAPYVSTAFVHAHGRLGRSWGCPAVRQDIAPKLVRALEGRSLLFAYYPNSDFLQHAPSLNACASLSRQL